MTSFLGTPSHDTITSEKDMIQDTNTTMSNSPSKQKFGGRATIGRFSKQNEAEAEILLDNEKELKDTHTVNKIENVKKDVEKVIDITREVVKSFEDRGEKIEDLKTSAENLESLSNAMETNAKLLAKKHKSTNKNG
ncbi:unnamed protein product [Allacma fusca]|uniref:V-SNARE coiled-coil homology domain-containing protein n=1 Tax=Allacma fusca TaxID=39272 RepID=A0A8J2JBA9_9HEXA|nr:unnamed protein product [Allacma fusca]